MHKDVGAELEGFYSPRELSTQPHELNPTELANAKANPDKKN